MVWVAPIGSMRTIAPAGEGGNPDASGVALCSHCHAGLRRPSGPQRRKDHGDERQ
jgi:hypothetical protein